MSRLDYAPKLKEIHITDIKKGLGTFTPKPDKPASFAALKETLKKAGYTLAAADIRVAGSLDNADRGSLTVVASGQRFTLEGADLERLLSTVTNADTVEVAGDWKTAGQGAAAREVITVREVKKAGEGASGPLTPNAMWFQRVSFYDSAPSEEAKPLAPIRVTSPGLTVYKGGAITPRLYFIEQHLGDLNVSRQVFDLGVSYTPSARVQLEAEVPVSRTSFENGADSGSRTGLGNITLWSKYRFFRKVKTYGDRQAALRFGLELPTGKDDAPQVNAPAFVRQQLTPISGGLSPHFDIAFSQAGGRFIFGGNAEGILRSERDGFRMGHEIRVNTDLEYVLLPRDYDAPGGELFMIIETSFVHRGSGRLAGVSVSGSNSTEYYIAPGLQYAAAPRFVVEGSIQLPLVLNTGPLVLRNDRNILLGVRYLF
ncbi:MAG TPA: transporter [Pyrinomonadaceae bacterium]|nr:transporter [Pyrinomonadaceae bacterium]